MQVKWWIGARGRLLRKVTQGAQALEKVTKEVEGAAKKAKQALQRTAKTAEKTAGKTESSAKKVTDPATEAFRVWWRLWSLRGWSHGTTVTAPG